MTAPKLSDRERLSVQLGNVTAASIDLRHHMHDQPFRELVWKVRAVRDAAWPVLPFVSASPYEWAAERLRVRIGLSTNAWWIPGESPAEHTDATADVRLVLEWLEATR